AKEKVLREAAEKTAKNAEEVKQIDEVIKELTKMAGMAENIKTFKNVDAFLASAEKLAKLNITAKTALKYLDEALVHFNHRVVDGVLVQIGDRNCVNVVKVVDEYLKTGKIIKADLSDIQNIFELEKIYGKSFLTYKIPNLRNIMKEGERGIIFGDKGIGRAGHVFNVIKKDGDLLFRDGQNGLNANIQNGYISFKYLKTN
ncbi:MAG: hypothetical protein ACOVLC_02930, partial [Flavobacterium sp.]